MLLKTKSRRRINKYELNAPSLQIINKYTNESHPSVNIVQKNERNEVYKGVSYVGSALTSAGLNHKVIEWLLK